MRWGSAIWQINTFSVVAKIKSLHKQHYSVKIMTIANAKASFTPSLSLWSGWFHYRWTALSSRVNALKNPSGCISDQIPLYLEGDLCCVWPYSFRSLRECFLCHNEGSMQLICETTITSNSWLSTAWNTNFHLLMQITYFGLLPVRETHLCFNAFCILLVAAIVQMLKNYSESVEHQYIFWTAATTV